MTVLYAKVKNFIQNHLFDKAVDLDNLNTFRNLSETEATRTIQVTFKEQINKLTIQDHGTSEIKDYIKLRNTRPFVANEQAFFQLRKASSIKSLAIAILNWNLQLFLKAARILFPMPKTIWRLAFKIDYI